VLTLVQHHLAAVHERRVGQAATEQALAGTAIHGGRRQRKVPSTAHQRGERLRAAFDATEETGLLPTNLCV